MKSRGHLLLGLGLLAGGVGFLLAGMGRAGDDKAAKEGILKIADAIAKGEDVSGHAKALAKKIEEIDEVMNLMRPRKGAKGGLGVGSKPGAIQPDGIELKLVQMGRDAPSAATAAKQAEALEKMAHVIAAIAEVSIARPDKKKPKNWIKYAKEMRDAAPKLAAAAKAKSPAELQKAAAAINAACNNCHTDYK